MWVYVPLRKPPFILWVKHTPQVLLNQAIAAHRDVSEFALPPSTAEGKSCVRNPKEQPERSVHLGHSQAKQVDSTSMLSIFLFMTYPLHHCSSGPQY